MPVKTNGEEFKKYYTDDSIWPDGTWHDDVLITVDGINDPGIDLCSIEDSAVVVISGGVFLTGTDADNNAPSLETHFKRWRKAQNVVFLTVEVPRELEEAVVAAITAAGGKVEK